MATPTLWATSSPTTYTATPPPPPPPPPRRPPPRIALCPPPPPPPQSDAIAIAEKWSSSFLLRKPLTAADVASSGQFEEDARAAAAAFDAKHAALLAGADAGTL